MKLYWFSFYERYIYRKCYDIIVSILLWIRKARYNRWVSFLLLIIILYLKYIKYLKINLLKDGLIETLRRTRVKFIHCILPQHNAGCTDNKSLLSVKSNQSEDSVINVPLLRSQVKI